MLRGTGLVMGLLLICGSVQAAKGGKGKGQINPYSASIIAMQNVDQVTDVTATFFGDDAYPAPETVKHLWFKSLDENGNALWTDNSHNIDLINGAYTESYTDLVRGQPVELHAQVKTDAIGHTQVIRNFAHVVLRPDMAVISIDAPESIHVGQEALVNVVFSELNGDLGADWDAVLSEGGALLDKSATLHNDAGTAATVVFSVSFDEPGIYTLDVSALNVSPADYDLSNNTDSFQVEVVNARTIDSYFYSNYYWRDQDHESNTTDWWGSSRSTNVGQHENLYAAVWTDQTASEFPFTFDVNISVDGNSVISRSYDIESPTRSYGYNGCYQVDYYQEQISDHEWIYVQSYNYDCNNYEYQQTYGYYSKYATDYVAFSERLSSVYGDYRNDYSQVQGAFLQDGSIEPGSVFSFDMTLSGGDGTSLGSTWDMSVCDNSYHNEWDYTYGSRHYWGHSHVNAVYGYRYEYPTYSYDHCNRY